MKKVKNLDLSGWRAPPSNLLERRLELIVLPGDKENKRANEPDAKKNALKL